jgi:hypothetical protein
MKKLKRKIYLGVVAVAMIAMALPLAGNLAGGRVRAAANNIGAVRPSASTSSGTTVSGPTVPVEAPNQNGPHGVGEAAKASGHTGEGKPLSAEMLKKLGIPVLQRQGGKSVTQQSIEIGKKMASELGRRQNKKGSVTPQSAEPVDAAANAALSTAVITNIGGRSSQFDEVDILADWSGAEQFSANHSGKVDDFSGKPPVTPTGSNEFQLTRTAISEHTIANGFPEDLFYYGDSFGNVYVSTTTSLTQAFPVPNFFPINLPTILNEFGNLDSDDQIVVTGLAVSPVVDLTSFANVSPAFASFANLIGEVLYVAFTDTGTGFNLNPSAPGTGELIRSGLLAFPVADIPSAASVPPGILSATGFPVQVGGAFGVEFSIFDNEAGVAVDDDGSAYVQQVDLVGFTGGNIVKIASTDDPVQVGGNSGWQDRSLATNGIFVFNTLNPVAGTSYFLPPPLHGAATGVASAANGSYGETILTPFTVGGVGGKTVTQINTATNYSGTANLFGNIEALATGPCNNVYAAVAGSSDGVPADAAGPFATGSTALGATPTMVIRFSDVVGSFAPCTVPDNPISGLPIPGAIGVPIADGFADVVPPAGGGAIPAVVPGVNNFIVFVEGDGPDLRVAPGGSSAVNATTGNTLQINDGVGFQVDPSIYNGITVDREGTVYVVSGGTPAGVGDNPSPTFGEILAFPDNCPQDGRADFVDFRTASTLPDPPLAAPNGIEVGDGLSTRADHIFWIAPLDVVNGENDPTAIAGLNIGFELYLNRTRTADNTPELPNGQPQAESGVNGPVIFEQLDPSHQVAGGDDQTFPFTGDDNDGAGNNGNNTIGLTGLLSGGFEFLFANPTGDVFASDPLNGLGHGCGVGTGVWNGTFWNANGNLTFGEGDSSNLATEIAFRSGPPMIAAAWCALDTGSRGTDVGGVPTGFANTFPVQALGFAGINDFEFRNIDVPEAGNETCGSSNTFSTFLFDDGTLADENASQLLDTAEPIGNNSQNFDLMEGPTALRYVKEPTTGVIVGCPPRQDGTGHFAFLYGRMDLLGTPAGPGGDPVIVGFSIGNQNPLNPPALCGIDLGGAAITADTDKFRPCLIGEGTEPEVFELFDTGAGPNTSGSGNPTFATPDFDLRCEGNGAALAAAINTRQTDPNRGRLGFFGTTCEEPPAPTCATVVPTTPVAVPPGDPAVGTAAAATPNGQGQKNASATAGIVNALCAVQVNVVGCGIIPNETTIICQTPEGQTGLAETRNGKTVSSSMVFGCDTTGTGVPDLFFPLSNVTPVSANLIQGTFAVNPTVLSAPTGDATGPTQLPGTGFPLTCCGGVGVLTTTTTFSAGNNNVFNNLPAGGFALSFMCTIDIGPRAPVVISAQGNSALNCSGPDDINIVGSCFVLPNGVQNVTSVFAVDQATGAIIEATSFTVFGPNQLDAEFNFGSVNAGHTFLIFVSGPNGTSRNLSSPSGTCPAGNEQGVIVTVTCAGGTTTTTSDAPTLTSCGNLHKNSAGTWLVTLTGTNIVSGATVSVNGSPAKFKALGGVQTGSAFTEITVKGAAVRKDLPGTVTLQNPPGVNAGTATLQCNLSPKE